MAKRALSTKSASFVRRALAQGESTWVTVEGRSMRPLLGPGDAVLIQPCAAATLRPGDIVTFADRATLCTHRVIMTVNEAGRRLLLTKGDACARWDAPVAPESVVGKGVAIRRGGLPPRGGRQRSLEGAAWQALNLLMLAYSITMGWLLWVKWKLVA